MRKESIGEILDSGGSIRFPYKTDLKDWYSEISIAKLEGSYHISPGMTFYSFDAAINYLFSMILAPKNAAYIIDRLKRRGIECDLEYPDENYLTEFKTEKKVVSDEFKKLNIAKQKRGTKEEIEDFLDKASDRIVTNEFPICLHTDLRLFVDLYALNSPYISISFCYSIESQESIFRNGVELKDLTPYRLEAARKLEIFNDKSGVKYLFTELNVSYYPKEGGGRIYKRYELKI
jgi:hypothetical protein